MRIPLIADERKPKEFKSKNDYLIIADFSPISVGDVISVGCRKDMTAKVLAIWVTFVIKHVAVKKTESGYKHIIRLDKNLGDVKFDHIIDVQII